MHFWLLLVTACTGLRIQAIERCTLYEYGKRVNCSNKSLYEIPTDFPLDIISLDASYNYLHLPQWPLPYSNLINLNLSNSRLHAISSVDFLHLNALEILDLSGNNFKHLSQIDSSLTFLFTINLKSLRLNSNPLRSLNDDPLRSESLIDLHLNECDIRSLEGNSSLTWLPNLKRIHLNGNPIVKIDSLQSHSLEEVYLRGTHLRYIRSNFYTGLNQLKILDLSNNAHLPALSKNGVASSPTLEILLAEFCALDYVEVNGFPNLIELNLRGNRISIIQAGDFQANQKLIQVDLSDNWIKKIDSFGFTGVESLTKLDISGNRLGTLENWVFEMDMLTWLNVSKNPLTSLEGIERLDSLQIFDASHCDLSSIPVLMFNLRELEIINVSHNSLTDLPPALNSASLIELYLSYNRLSRIDDAWLTHFPRLKILSLAGNRLTEPFPKDTIMRLSHTHVYLRDNPWRCSCNEPDYIFFYNWTKGKGDWQSVTCHSPHNISGRTWRSACFQIVTPSIPNKRHTWLPLLMAGISVLLVIAIIVAVKAKMFSLSAPSGSSNASPPWVPPHSTTTTEVTSPNPEVGLPTYEQALLLPKPQTDTGKSNADTQTMVSYVGSTRSLASRQKSLSHSPSSNSL